MRHNFSRTNYEAICKSKEDINDAMYQDYLCIEYYPKDSNDEREKADIHAYLHSMGYHFVYESIDIEKKPYWRYSRL